jgi:hypothetical protein
VRFERGVRLLERRDDDERAERAPRRHTLRASGREQVVRERARRHEESARPERELYHSRRSVF